MMIITACADRSKYVTAPVGDRSEGKYIKIIIFDVYLVFFRHMGLGVDWGGEKPSYRLYEHF